MDQDQALRPSSGPDRTEGRIALRVANASKSYGAVRALVDGGFEVRSGEIHALLGGNGSGKSTLFKLLAGVEPADGGVVELDGHQRDLSWMTPGRARSAGLHFVHQHQSTFPDMSVAENLAAGHGFATAGSGVIRWRAQRRHASRVLERFGIQASPSQLLGELGPATHTMVAIARALQDQDDSNGGVLLLDEPTAALPSPEADTLFEALRRYAEAGQAIVIVTHRMKEVFALANGATVLRDGRVVADVNPRRTTEAELVQLMMGKAVAHAKRAGGQDPGAVVLAAKGLCAGPVLDATFELRSGEILGLAGLIGSGRSSVLRALFGHQEITRGDLEVHGTARRWRSTGAAMKAGIAMVPEARERDAAFPELSITENGSIAVLSRFARRRVINRRRERRESSEMVRRYGVKCSSTDAPLRSLSGGNQQKVILGRWLRGAPRILLLDEPTQGVDVGARADIYDFVNDAVDAGAAVVVASSDFEELSLLCDRVLVMWGGRIVAELVGDQITEDHIAMSAHTGAGHAG